MKSGALIFLALCGHFFCHASESRSSSSSSQSASLPNVEQLVREAEELLGNSLQETLPLKRSIKMIKDKLKSASTAEKEVLMAPYNKLRIEWAQILLTKLTEGPKQPSDEIVDCILHLEAALHYELEAMQLAWGNKNTFRRKGTSVELTLEQRQKEIDVIKDEAKVWQDRTSFVTQEMKASPEPLTKELLTQDDQKHPEFAKVHVQLQGIDELLRLCKEAARKVACPDENNDDDDSEEDAQVGAKLQAIDEHFEAIGRELRKDILSTLERRPEQINVEEVHTEFAALISALPHTISAVQHALSNYLVTLERIKKNRTAYSEYRLQASSRCEVEHSLALQDHDQHRLLRARLKLFIVGPRLAAAGEATKIQPDEIKLLENNKGVLSKKEKDALAQINGGLWASFRS